MQDDEKDKDEDDEWSSRYERLLGHIGVLMGSVKGGTLSGESKKVGLAGVRQRSVSGANIAEIRPKALNSRVCLHWGHPTCIIPHLVAVLF